MQQKSTWSENVIKNEYPELVSGEALTSDVVIVGAGITGIISAYLLSKEGMKVMVLEKGQIGSGATMLTTAFLTQSIDTDFTDLIKICGIEKAKIIIDSHKQAIDTIEKIIKNENIECDFARCSNYMYANSEKDAESLEDEFAAAKQLGVEATLTKEGSALGFKNFGFIEMRNQAKFHPLKFITALAEIMVKNGVQIFEHLEVKKIESKDGVVSIKTENQTITASWALVTTYEPFNKPLKLYFKKAFYTSYVFEVMVKGLELQEGTYEDTENPYHYLRIDKEKEGYRMIIGGEDHRSDIHVNKEKSFNALKEYLATIIPAENYTIVKQWSGPVLEPVDGLPSIGPLDKENVLYAMAFSGNGMTYAGITALLFKDYIQNKNNSWKEIYSTHRTPGFKALMTKGKDYSEELVRGAVKNTFTKGKK